MCYGFYFCYNRQSLVQGWCSVYKDKDNDDMDGYRQRKNDESIKAKNSGIKKKCKMA